MGEASEARGFLVRHGTAIKAASASAVLMAGVLGTVISVPWFSRGSPEYAVIRVHYGTDRERTGSRAPAELYGSERGAMQYGYCDVSIPRDHRMGELEAPSVLKLEFREDPEKHVVLLFAAPMEREVFLREVNAEIGESGVSEAFVFVHGYNVSFEDAARRTAQMKYDLGFGGPAIFFSWPSKATVAGYPADEATIEWATPDLLTFLRDVAGETGASTVHVIAHSMGNRGVTRALGEIAAGGDAELKSKFREIVLAAPDIDRDVFIRDIVPRLTRLGARVTLYASSGDRALLASKRFHQYPRAGELSAGPLIVPGIDSIDASGVDTSLLGHSYFAQKSSLLADLYYLINPTPPIPAGRRFALEEVAGPEGTYWRFRN